MAAVNLHPSMLSAIPYPAYGSAVGYSPPNYCQSTAAYHLGIMSLPTMEERRDMTAEQILMQGKVGDSIECEVYRATRWERFVGRIESIEGNGFIIANSGGLRWTCGPNRIDGRNFRLLKLTKGEHMIDSMKEYVTKHRDIFFTIGFILILDHFVFGGAFKEKIQDLIHKFLDKQTTKAE